MKTRFALALLLACSAGALALAEDELPKRLAFARYEAMTNRSPFAVATAATPPPQAPTFAKDLYIANAAKLEDEGVVTLSSNIDKNMKEYLSTKGPNKSGYTVSNIEWSDRVGATKVTISKDGQFATLTFNQALLAQPVASGQPPIQQVTQPTAGVPIPGGPVQGGAVMASTPIPVQTPMINQVMKPAPIPTLPTPPPRVRGVIQRNPNAIATPVPDDRAQLMQDQ